MVKTICTSDTVPYPRMKPGIKQLWKHTKNTETITKPKVLRHPTQVWRDKIASLKYSRDYSFLFPLEDQIADCKSSPLRDGSAMKVEGLVHDKKVGAHLGCDQKDAEGLTRRRLIIRFRITAEGKAQVITHASNFNKVGSEFSQDSQKPLHHSTHETGDKAERAASLVTEICKEIKEKDEIKRERFKIGAPKWKRICKPKVSLGAPRFCAA